MWQPMAQMITPTFLSRVSLSGAFMLLLFCHAVSPNKDTTRSKLQGICEAGAGRISARRTDMGDEQDAKTAPRGGCGLLVITLSSWTLLTPTKRTRTMITISQPILTDGGQVGSKRWCHIGHTKQSNTKASKVTPCFCEKGFDKKTLAPKTSV